MRRTTPVEADGVPIELNLLALIKGEERYLFIYDDASRAMLIDIIRDQAADQHLSLSWFDATVLTQKAREQAGSRADDEAPSPDRIGEPS